MKDFRMKGSSIMKPSVKVVITFLLLVSTAHLLRLIFQANVMLNNSEIPMWMSAAACIVTALLALWLLRENKKKKTGSFHKIR
jgi:uncharacterized membrane protein